MTATALTVTTPPGPTFPLLPLTAGSAAITFAAADDSNGNTWVATGRDVLLAWNTDSGAHTITVTSQVDSLNRKGDITNYSIAAGAIAALVFPIFGWADASNKITVTADDATVTLAVLRLPSLP